MFSSQVLKGIGTETAGSKQVLCLDLNISSPG
jgi:hypothetical protein